MRWRARPSGQIRTDQGNPFLPTPYASPRYLPLLGELPLINCGSDALKQGRKNWQLYPTITEIKSLENFSVFRRRGLANGVSLFFSESETEENGKKGRKWGKKRKQSEPEKNSKKGKQWKRRKTEENENNGRKRKKKKTSEATPFRRPLLRNPERCWPSERLPKPVVDTKTLPKPRNPSLPPNSSLCGPPFLLESVLLIFRKFRKGVEGVGGRRSFLYQVGIQTFFLCPFSYATLGRKGTQFWGSIFVVFETSVFWGASEKHVKIKTRKHYFHGIFGGGGGIMSMCFSPP